MINLTREEAQKMLDALNTVYGAPRYEASKILRAKLSELQREWVGLTDVEIKNIVDCGRPDLVNIKKAEQLLKDKNAC